jgi:hypothetical protein
MTLDMASGRVRLKGRELLEKYGVTMYRIGKDGDVSYPTVHKYLTAPDSVKHFSTEVLYGLLMGLGLSIEEAEQLRLGDVFEFVPDGNGEELAVE